MKGGSWGLRVAAVAGLVLVVSLVAGAYAAGREIPRISAAEAATFAQLALTDSGAQRVEVSGEPRAESFTPVRRGEDGEAEPAPDPVDVWVVPVTVSGQPVELYVAQAGGRAVNLDDALPDGGFVLDEEQFDRLERYRLDLAKDRVSAQRQGPSIAAGLLIAMVAVAMMTVVVTGRAQTSRTEEA